MTNLHSCWMIQDMHVNVVNENDNHVVAALKVF